MPKRLRVPPTKSALLRLRRQLEFLVDGHALLDRKRELLTRLVYTRLARYRSLREQTHAGVGVAYRWLNISQMRMGTRRLHQVSLGLAPCLALKILPRSTLGVEYASVTATPLALQPVGLAGTDASLDASRAHLLEAAVLLARLAEAETALRRLLLEQRKTQKRVNALQYNVIPKYRETIRFIESALAEEERNALFQIKVLRDRPGEASA